MLHGCARLFIIPVCRRWRQHLSRARWPARVLIQKGEEQLTETLTSTSGLSHGYVHHTYPTLLYTRGYACTQVHHIHDYMHIYAYTHTHHTAIYTWICMHTCTPHTRLHAHICIYTYMPHGYIYMNMHAHRYATHMITCTDMHTHIHATWPHTHEYEYAYMHPTHTCTHTMITCRDMHKHTSHDHVHQKVHIYNIHTTSEKTVNDIKQKATGISEADWLGISPILATFL